MNISYSYSYFNRALFLVFLLLTLYNSSESKSQLPSGLGLGKDINISGKNKQNMMKCMITGGNRGIGLGLVKFYLSHKGYDLVVATSRSPSPDLQALLKVCSSFFSLLAHVIYPLSFKFFFLDI